jgi:hypothetical protein
VNYTSASVFRLHLLGVQGQGQDFARDHRHVIVPMEGKLFQALCEEAEKTQRRQSAGKPGKRDVFDDSTGARMVTYHAKQSFICGLSRPGHRVLRLTN